MKNRKFNILLLFILTVLILSSCVREKPAASLHSEYDEGYIPCVLEQLDIEILSGQAFVYDVNNNEFIYIKGSGSVVYPASTTKLLTILYALEILNPDEIISPGNELEMIAKDSSIAYIKTYHKISVEMLIEGMLLPSGNDAAYALAAATGRKLAGDADVDGKKAVEYFIDGMNSYAKEIGLCGSHFTSPDGYYTEDHYTTIEDMALIAKLASQNEIILKYSSLQCDDVTYASGHTNHWTNTNLMLDKSSEFYCKYVTGLKTGSAGTGNYSFICTVDFGGELGQFIIGIFSSATKEERFSDALNIIEYLNNEQSR